MTGLSLRGVRNAILRRLDLDVGAGELLVVVGPSGAGKTTLLRVVAGLVPHQGGITADGAPLDRLPPHRRRIGYVPQDLCLFPHMSVLDNVLVGMPRGTPVERERRARALLERVGIPGLAARRPDGLSGGERQRAALARALAAEPRLLLLDEPFSSLDHQTRRRLRCDLKGVQRDLGLTTLFVTHDLAEAHEMADRILVMRDGLLLDDGDDFLPRPNHLACAGPRPVAAGLLAVDWGGQTLLVLDEGVPPARLRILPGDVAVGAAVAGTVNLFRARVAALNRRGDAAIMRLEVAGGSILAECAADAAAEPGREIAVQLPLRHLRAVP